MPQPNILILMTDQQRADCMGCAGHPQLETPNMDRLAAEGVRFSRAVTSSPLCMPARASFISGLPVREHGMWWNKGELAPDAPSLFRRLQDQGYYTAHVGKSHYYPHGGPHMREREDYMHARGFDYVHETTGPWATTSTDSYMTDHWRELGLLEDFREDYRKRWERRRNGEAPVWPSPLPTEEFMDSYIGREGVRFIGEHGGRRPFCLFVGFGGPHEPWDAPGEYATMYNPNLTPPPIPPAEPPGWLPEEAADWQLSGRKERLTRADVARLRANYYGKISLIDHWFGRILEACEQQGLLEEMLVVFWSDHGEMAGDHGLLYKSRFFESAVNVPFIFRWPGSIEAGRTWEALVQTTDIMPTLLEAVGSAPAGDGESLWPIFEGAAERVREAAVSEVGRGERRNTMVRTDRYKYAVHEDGTPYMLYDLQEDPTEQRNLLGHSDSETVAEEMHRRLQELDGV